MFEGLFSPAHLAIIVFVVFMVFGPRTIVDRWHRTGERLRKLGDGETHSAPTPSDEAQSVAEQREPSQSGAYRLARRLRGRRP